MTRVSPRVVITGMGAVTAAGLGVDALWSAARSGNSAVRPLTAAGFENSRIRHAALASFDQAAHFSPEHNNTLDRFSALALVAAEEALARSKLLGDRLGVRCAVIIGSGIGGAVTSDAASFAYHVTGQRADPMSIPKIMPSAAASQISMRYGASGPTFCVSSACASSTQAVGLGIQLIRAGVVDRAVVGEAKPC